MISWGTPRGNQMLIEISDRSDRSQSSIYLRQSVVIHLLFFISGFSALVYQVAYQRLLGLFAGTDSISVAIVVGAFLLGLGLGSLLAGAFADRLSRRAVILAFAFCEFAIAAFAIASKVFFYDFLFGRMVDLSGNRWLVFLILSRTPGADATDGLFVAASV
jgi:fucose permease